MWWPYYQDVIGKSESHRWKSPVQNFLGSVLSPILFSLHSQPLSDVFKRHGCQFHKDADDTQLDETAPPLDLTVLLCNISLCITAVKEWNLKNRQCLNDSKTEVLCSRFMHCLFYLQNPTRGFYQNFRPDIFLKASTFSLELTTIFSQKCSLCILSNQF